MEIAALDSLHPLLRYRHPPPLAGNCQLLTAQLAAQKEGQPIPTDLKLLQPSAEPLDLANLKKTYGAELLVPH